MIYNNLFKFIHLSLESEILFCYNFIKLIDSVLFGIVIDLVSGAISFFSLQSFYPPRRLIKKISVANAVH
jgi:hypothetical protein